MHPINRYFSRIFVINLDRRADRWQECVEQFRMFGIHSWERFAAYADVKDDSGKPNGNCGCTASHRALLEVIAYQHIPRALVLEDDFQIVHGDFTERFEAAIRELPENWDMLYLGGHYGEAPISRVSPHVIRCGRMLTTSSYGITCGMARRMAPHISGVGPIDSLYGGFHRDNNCLILSPRLMIQRPSFSDLQERDMDNSACMLDESHEKLV